MATQSLNPEKLDRAIYRNFGGKPALLEATLRIFHEKCFGSSANKHRNDSTNDNTSNANPERPITPPHSSSTLSLVRANLADSSARHLMILSRAGAALPLLFGCGVLSLRHCSVLVGSAFEEDKGELRLVQQINAVKRATVRHFNRVINLHNHWTLSLVFLNNSIVYMCLVGRTLSLHLSLEPGRGPRVRAGRPRPNLRSPL